MKYREWRFMDKSAWPFGEWFAEPDKIQFPDDATGLPCLIVRNYCGNLCGYVGIPEGHQFFGVDYSECSRRPQCAVDEDGFSSYCGHEPSSLLEAHGGITFTGSCDLANPETGICHIPGSGEADKIWWIGFDCGHWQDYSPGMDAQLKSFMIPRIPIPGKVYRNVEYVKNQCRRLAAQLHDCQQFTEL